ncbi:MAG: hypothetical protein ABIU87_12705 [Ornithinibacter sp.]
MRGPLFLLLAFIAVVVVLAIAIGLFFASRSRKQQEQRVEAAGIRSDAGELAATVTGQASFAEQAEERAAVVRAEADRKAREAAALESEASAHRDQAEATRRDYEAQLRRADEIDPDVDDSSLPPVDDAPPTRAERRAAREEADASAHEAAGATAAEPTGEWASTAPTAGALGGAAVGSPGTQPADGSPGTDDGESSRVASAADFRDEVGQEVYDGTDRGTVRDMSQTQQPDSDAPLSQDREGEHNTADVGAPDGEMAMIADPDEFASTEPIMASEQSPPVERTDLPARAEDADAGSEDERAGEVSEHDRDDDHSGHDDHHDHADHSGHDDDHDHADHDHVAGGDGTATSDVGESAEQGGIASTPVEGGAEQVSEERYDDTPTKDWSADEGELLDENHERGDRLAQDRADLESREQGPAGSEGGVTEAADSGASATDVGSSGADSEEEPAGRRVSSFTELRDGGFGVGSAAPIEDRSQPLDHPVQAYRDTMTFRAPGDPGYDSAEPDVWFYDESAAERSGFTRSQG